MSVQYCQVHLNYDTTGKCTMEIFISIIIIIIISIIIINIIIIIIVIIIIVMRRQ